MLDHRQIGGTQGRAIPADPLVRDALSEQFRHIGAAGAAVGLVVAQAMRPNVGRIETREIEAHTLRKAGDRLAGRGS